MSSILRALKKLEKERPQEAEFQTWQEKYSLPETRKPDRKVFFILAGIALLCGVLFLANQLAVWQMRSIANNQLASLPSAPVQTKPEQEVQGVVHTVQALAEDVSVLDTDVVAVEPEVSSAPIPNLASPEPATVPVEEIRQAEEGQEYPLLDDPVLIMQSISWAVEPGQRLAVISNQIVRMGGMVEGYQVVAINLNDVVVKRDGRQWRVLFPVR